MSSLRVLNIILVSLELIILYLFDEQVRSAIKAICCRKLWLFSTLYGELASDP